MIAQTETFQATFWQWVSETPKCKSCGRSMVKRTTTGTNGESVEVLQCRGNSGRGFRCGMS